MKKILALTCLLVLLFSSCVSVKKFDESVPEEKTARIFTGGIGTVTGYNGISVNWERVKGFSFVFNQIPAGDTTLEIDVDAQLSSFYDGGTNTTYRKILQVKGALFKFNFQPQKEYYFEAAQKDNTYGLSVYAWNYGEKGSGSGGPSTWTEHFVAFVPFQNVTVK